MVHNDSPFSEQLITEVSQIIPEDIANTLFKSPILPEFNHYKYVTPCPFATKSPICGGYSWTDDEDAVSYTKRNVPLFAAFAKIYHQHQLDGIVFEISTKYAYDIPSLAKTINQMLRCLASHTSKGEDCMLSDITQPTWRFTFDETEFFINVSADFYPSNHFRYSHKAGFASIMFLTIEAFSSIAPKTSQVFSKIAPEVKQAFKDKDMVYLDYHHPASEYVRPLNPEGSPVEWWKY